MGIRGLESFLEKRCPEACHKVNIKTLLDKYRSDKSTDSVLIVVDGSSCLHHLYGDLNWLLGAQLKEYVRRIQNFVDAFQSIGITLVFYFDGPTVQRKHAIWISRRLDDLKKVYETFDTLRRGAFSAEDEKRLFLLPYGLGTIVRYTLKYVCNCDVRVSLLECDEEIAAFARENKCFAILGQDTDFVIHEGAKFYLSMKNLDLKSMQTLCYDRSAFAQYLRIPLWHLPLLATLCGNDVLSAADLKDFHMRECIPPNQRGKFQNYVPFPVVLHGVADYIRKKRFERELRPHTLSLISWAVFRDEGNAGAALIESSLKSYTACPELPEYEVSESNWSKILSLARARLVLAEQTSTLYPIMIGAPYECCTALEDFRLRDLPAAAELLRVLRQRIYGILLKEKEGRKEVEERCVVGERVEKWDMTVAPIFPAEGLHPGLLALWSDDASLDDQRWELFARTITLQLSAAALRSLPSRLVIPAAVMAYLRTEIPEHGEPHLLAWELDAMAIQAVLLTTTEPSVLVVQPPYISRAIRLATVFLRAVSHMMLLLAACGSPIPLEEVFPWLYFDGKLFHSTYKSLMEPEPKSVTELCVNQAGQSLYEEYQLLRAVIQY